MTEDQKSEAAAPPEAGEAGEAGAGEAGAGEASAGEASAGEASAPAEAPSEAAPAAARLAPEAPRLPPPLGAAQVTPDVAPGYGFLTVVSLLSLVSDLATKVWAKERLEQFPGYVTVWEKKWSAGVAGMSFILAHNKGGAWGLLQGTNENVRKPFFLLVSVAAIAFIVTLFRRLQPSQLALKWGLPLVLGGALGNVFDRIRYGSVIDFIDVHLERAGVDHHWPTFNVADIAICVGVGLMAVDMFTAKRQPVPARRRRPMVAALAAASGDAPAASGDAPEASGDAPAAPKD